MAITLEQSKVGMTNKVDQTVVDLTRRESDLIDKMIFDNAVSPTGGSTLGYSYMQIKTPSTCAFRKINEEYTAGESIRELKSSQAKIFGGKFGVDRVIAATSSTALDELAFQLQQKIKGAVNLFNYTLINGDTAKDPESFDGLDKLLTGSETEYNPAVSIDLSTSATMTTNAELFIDTVDEWLGTMSAKPDFLIMNEKMSTKFKSIARKVGYYTQAENAFGGKVSAYDNIPFYTVQQYYDATKSQLVPIVPVDAKGETSIYAVKMGLDGFHGISPMGNTIMQTYTKEKNATGVIIDGEVEAIMGVVLRDTSKAGVLRGIKIKTP